MNNRGHEGVWIVCGSADDRRTFTQGNDKVTGACVTPVTDAEFLPRIAERLCRWHRHIREVNMREHYDFESMKGKRNPYAARLKQPISIRLDRGTVAYFKHMSTETGIPYQNLINLYLRDCAANRKKLQMKWG
jgi:uncharacterized protein (DUF4415 family)